MRPVIRNSVVPLVIRDYSELVKGALLVEHHIEDTNKIQEQKGDRKGNKKWGKVSKPAVKTTKSSI